MESADGLYSQFSFFFSTHFWFIKIGLSLWFKQRERWSWRRNLLQMVCTWDGTLSGVLHLLVSSFLYLFWFLVDATPKMVWVFVVKNRHSSLVSVIFCCWTLSSFLIIYKNFSERFWSTLCSSQRLRIDSYSFSFIVYFFPVLHHSKLLFDGVFQS